MISTIYSVKHIPSGRYYIGSTTTSLIKRKQWHYLIARQRDTTDWCKLLNRVPEEELVWKVEAELMCSDEDRRRLETKYQHMFNAIEGGFNERQAFCSEEDRKLQRQRSNQTVQEAIRSDPVRREARTAAKTAASRRKREDPQKLAKEREGYRVKRAKVKEDPELYAAYRARQNELQRARRAK